MLYYLRDKRGFLTLLGMIFALVIACYLFYIVLNAYFRKPASDKKIDKALSEQGIDTSSYQRIEETTRKKINDITKEHLNELENIEKQLNR